jgi:hypothetical protein
MVNTSPASSPSQTPSLPPCEPDRGLDGQETYVRAWDETTNVAMAMTESFIGLFLVVKIWLKMI